MCVFNYEGGWQPRGLALGLPMLANRALGSSLTLPAGSKEAVETAGGDAALRARTWVYPQLSYLPSYPSESHFPHL